MWRFARSRHDNFTIESGDLFNTRPPFGLGRNQLPMGQPIRASLFFNCLETQTLDSALQFFLPIQTTGQSGLRSSPGFTSVTKEPSLGDSSFSQSIERATR